GRTDASGGGSAAPNGRRARRGEGVGATRGAEQGRPLLVESDRCPPRHHWAQAAATPRGARRAQPVPIGAGSATWGRRLMIDHISNTSWALQRGGAESEGASCPTGGPGDGRRRGHEP